MLDQQYPEFVVYTVICVGYLIAIINSYRGFQFAVLGLTSINYLAASETRIFLGPYFNLYDAFVLILVFCYVIDLFSKRKHQRYVPTIVWGLVIIIFIGLIEGLIGGNITLGLRYEVLRAARWAINLPIILLITSNFISDEERAGQFLKLLFIGGILASFQHFLVAFDIANASSMTRYYSGMIRNIGFQFSPAAYFLVTAFIRPILPFGDRNYHKIIWLGGTMLFAASVIFTQTRSMWIAVVLAPIPLALIVKERSVIVRLSSVTLLGIVVIGLLLPMASPRADRFVRNVLFERLELLTDGSQLQATSQTRRAAFEIEGRDWIEGNWLTGNGFAYQYYRYSFGQNAEHVAWGHLGYISYLVRLGIVGFLIYAVLLPLSALMIGRKLYFNHENELVRGLAMLACACIIVDAVTFLMSGSYIAFGVTTPSLLFGAMLGLKRILVNDEETIETFVPENIPHLQIAK